MTEVSPTLAAPMVDLRCTDRRCTGERHAYRMVGSCGNCRTNPMVGLFTSGHEARGGECPACGCRNLTWRHLEDRPDSPAPGAGSEGSER